MNARRALRAPIIQGQNVVEGYLADLDDADLLVRAVPETNHIAWQLGHCIYAEHFMVDLVRPGCMPKLPQGFHEQHNNDTAANDDPKAFLTKAQYLELFQAQRTGTLALLDELSDDQLSEPAPKELQSFLDTVGGVFAMQGTHWVMHAGQWAVIRRKLGRPPLF
jgi:hypothetical protein